MIAKRKTTKTSKTKAPPTKRRAPRTPPLDPPDSIDRAHDWRAAKRRGLRGLVEHGGPALKTPMKFPMAKDAPQHVTPKQLAREIEKMRSTLRDSVFSLTDSIRSTFAQEFRAREATQSRLTSLLAEVLDLNAKRVPLTLGTLEIAANGGERLFRAAVWDRAYYPERLMISFMEPGLLVRSLTIGGRSQLLEGEQGVPAELFTPLRSDARPLLLDPIAPHEVIEVTIANTGPDNVRVSIAMLGRLESLHERALRYQTLYEDLKRQTEARSAEAATDTPQLQPQMRSVLCDVCQVNAATEREIYPQNKETLQWWCADCLDKVRSGTLHTQPQNKGADNV